VKVEEESMKTVLRYLVAVVLIGSGVCSYVHSNTFPHPSLPDFGFSMLADLLVGVGVAFLILLNLPWITRTYKRLDQAHRRRCS
jgi:hypothetical protein